MSATPHVPAPIGSAPTLRRLVTPRRILISLGLALAAFCIILGFQASKQVQDTTPVRDVAVKDVFPREGALEPKQVRIGFQLDPAYTGVLLVDGAEIPLDQLVRPASTNNQANSPAPAGLAGLNQFFFTPGDGTATGTLEPGRHTATAVFWLLTEDQNRSRSYTWEFSVH